jgi:hypothetical protein
MLINKKSSMITTDTVTGVSRNDQHALFCFSCKWKLSKKRSCLVIFITYHSLHNNSVLDNQVYIDTLVDYFLGHDINLHYNKQSLSIDLSVDHMLNLHNLVDIHICMMYLHWYMYHNCMIPEHMHLHR